MATENSTVFDLDAFLVDQVHQAFDRGLRVSTLGDQPAPWLKRGLEILESGGQLTSEKIKSINLSGGTDHPDPWFH